MTVTLTDQDKITLRTAAYGAVSLLAAADPAGSPHKAATNGSLALASATGPIGHVLAEKSTPVKLTGRTAADMADQALPALTASMKLLKEQLPAEAGNFRTTITVAIDAATGGAPGPVMAEMVRKIIEALDAA
ncbi:hypothetical protein HII36_28980 [Nonomuraea sp. NN258]|uniref:hypothetical protein n=1 Tax=Nonomuraea antri TaxID=2730852 RepID=UPI00156899F5|nr:hypothetical protein [Nonomuraea antri]NRQ35838.1 hypothetical protein [Nonomuraea antri]